MKAFFFIISIIVFYNSFIINFNSFRYRMKLAAYDRHEWVMLINYACGILILMSVLPTAILFTFILIKNGINPIEMSAFSKVSGTVFGIFDIDRFKYVADTVYHPFTYSIFICVCDFIFGIKKIYNGITGRNLRTQYFWYWGYTVICYYLIFK